MSKLLSLEEAALMIQSGSHVSIGGFANSLSPLALVRQLIRNRVKNLEVSAMGEAVAVDMLSGVGALKHVRITNFMLEGHGRVRNFSRWVEEGRIEVEDYSHFGVTTGLFAGSVGLPFMPIKTMMGTDIENVRSFDGEKKFKNFECPFTGEKLLLMPALTPDFGLIHVSRADKNGNCQLYGIKSNIVEIAKASKKVIVTAEEIVDETEIRSKHETTFLPGFFVDAVVHAPFGAHPAGMYQYYDFDKEHIAEYAKATASDESYQQYVKEYIDDTKNEMGYLKKIGLKRLMDLRADFSTGISLVGRGMR